MAVPCGERSAAAFAPPRFAKHPAWIKRQHDDALEEEYVHNLADAMRCAFHGAAPGLEPTCAGMANLNATY